MGKPLAIRAPQQFQHAGQISADHDPRAAGFAFDELDIDLRACEFIRPAAVLWCVVYLAHARERRVPSRLLVPANMGVCVHLKATGVFDELKKRGVEIDDRGVGTGKVQKSILPLTPFATLSDAARITNEAFDRLQAANLASANVSPVVAELFSELANNAVEHSESSIGAFGWIQFIELEQGSRFVCVVADGGIGVKEGLWKNPVHRKRVSYDWDALELATRERVSGTGDPHKGIGLFAVAEDARQRRGSLLLHSGLGSLEIREDRESEARRTRLFPGTLAYLGIPA
jgi:hypothetical protein